MSSNNSSNCNSNSTNYKIGIVLFRCHDLRIVDQPALYHAVEGGNCENVIPLFLTSSACSGYHVPRAVDTTSTTTTTTTVSSSSSFVSGPTSLSSDSESTGAFDYAYGSDYHQRANAAEVWITEALHALNRSLADRGKGLTVRSCGRGTPTEVAAAVLRIVGDLHQLDSTITAKTAVLFANTRFEPNARSHDEELVRLLSAARIAVHFHNASLLYDPRDIRLCSGVEGKWRGHWGTLMPFVGACRSLGPPDRPLPAPVVIPSVTTLRLNSESLPTLGKQWMQKIASYWVITEEEALIGLEKFISGGLARYETERSRVDKDSSVSKLSAYIRHGLLSPRTIYWAIEESPLTKELKKTFSRRLFWRDLAYFQLHTFPNMSRVSIRQHYDAQEWVTDLNRLTRWCKGQTGFPVVDAAMRELWATGWLHQSLRMVVASFLIEYLGVDWRSGLAWFHNTLVDADVAINSMMWQNAGKSGIDQWNFILRPDEGKSRDPSGKHVRRWCPELKDLSLKYLFRPWTAPSSELAKAGVVLGQTYPLPVVTDLEAAKMWSYQATLRARQNALNFNDEQGYDLILLPNGRRTRVFTKQEYRIDKKGVPLADRHREKRQKTNKTIEQPPLY